MNIKIISAGAGSGKTYRLTEEMVKLLQEGVRANGIIATTFTNKAAAELQERVRIRLLEEGLPEAANDLTNALIGTVHGLGVKLLKRFAFEAGVSPEVAIIADEDQQILFNKSLATVLTQKRIEDMEYLSERIGLNSNDRYDWRKEVKNLTDVARGNNFSTEVLEKSKVLSFESFSPFLSKKTTSTADELNQKLEELLDQTISELEGNADSTKTTLKVVNNLKGIRNNLRLKGALNWHEWVKISKSKAGAKSREAVEELIEFAKAHDAHPEFHKDIQNYLYYIFEIVIAAIEEYDTYKKQRGLIDYIDMEMLVRKLLENDEVVKVLAEEIDLLMVDEFQDTNPIQLEIFLKLSKIVKHSIWVGDPKQSIYGFRGADPKLMQEIIRQTGGIKAEDIQKYSWRSREDIVNLTNALFTKAFHMLPKEQVALEAKRNKKAEPLQLSDAIQHWHFEFEEEGRLPGKPWMENCMASCIKRLLLDRDIQFLPKGETATRRVRAGDIAVLCRSNAACISIAESLHGAGLKAAIARVGLLNTAEAKLVLACLKFILHRSDSLSIAEILHLTNEMNTEEIIEDRLEYLEQPENQNSWNERWAEDNTCIKRLHELREQVADLSGAEILDLVLEELDLKRVIASWGKTEQRMANVDMLRHYALHYEEASNRLHVAASLGGFLLWLSDQAGNEKDAQGSGAGPDAVNVLTYHKSKGLEWPVVICHSLEGKPRESVFGMRIISESDEVDLENLLGNRWIRYWVNPYGVQGKNTLLDERIKASKTFAETKKSALEEDARLLYVGITRARDYLVFPTRKAETNWLNRVWHEGHGDYPTLQEDEAHTPWEWKDLPLAKNTDKEFFPRLFATADKAPEKIRYLAERNGMKEQVSYLIDPAKEPLPKGVKVKVGKSISCSAGLDGIEELNRYQLGKMMSAFIVGDNPTYDETLRNNMAQGHLDRYELSEELEATELLKNSSSFYHQLDDQFAYKKMLKRYPLKLDYEFRRFEGRADFLLETDNGLVLIINDDAMGEAKKLRKRAEQLGMQLYYSKLAVAKSFGQPVVKGFVYFVLDGQLVEILN